MGERAQLCDGFLQIAADLVDHRLGVGGVVDDGILCQAQFDGQRYQMLLCAIVQVAFELATLGVAGRDDAGARVTQLDVARLELLERCLQRRVELHVVQRQANLAGQLWNDAVAEAAAATLAAEFSPIGDMRASADYRRTVLGNLLRRFRIETRATLAGSPVITRIEQVTQAAD